MARIYEVLTPIFNVNKEQGKRHRGISSINNEAYIYPCLPPSTSTTLDPTTDEENARKEITPLYTRLILYEFG